MMEKKMKKIMLLIIGLTTLNSYVSVAQELTVYTARKEHLIQSLFDAYTEKTGVKIKFITDSEGPLMERLKAEGDKTPADLLITVDAGNLWYAANEGLLQTLDSEVLKNNIPAYLRDPENRWFGLSIRARTLVYNTEKVAPTEVSTYQDLAGPTWKGRLCLRTSKKVYNQSLTAMMIADQGIQATETIVKGWVDNLAAPVFADDTAVLQAVAAGQCDVGIVNTYYYGRLIEEQPNLPIALFWANQSAGGVHVNVSGGGVLKHAPHPEEALRFLEWLSSAEAQNLFADVNLEYPANPEVESHPTVQSWGEFLSNPINVSKAGEFQQEAVKLMDRAGYK